jgi:CDP-diacylglycerol--serine O-phosphatidyltransferase
MLISYPMFSLKFKREGKGEILFPVILLLLAIILLIVFKFAAISLIVLAYLLLAAIHNLLNQWNSSPK